MSDSLIEKVVGGVLIGRRYVSGNSLGREGTASEARQMVFNFRLDSSITQNLTVSISLEFQVVLVRQLIVLWVYP